MPYRNIALPLLALLATVLCPIATSAQGAPGSASGSPAPFRPGLADLMLMTVQPRHLTVGLAGQERNWAYLEFGVHELEASFEKIGRLVPKWRDFDMPALITSSVEALEEAVKAKSPERFDAAYAQLTQACNACHQSTKHGMIVIQAPRTSPFPNQDFRPAK
jgi:hypothetical protein